MLEIFNIRSTGSRGTFETPKLNYYFKKQKDALDKAMVYYKNNPQYVGSSHVLTALAYLLDFKDIKTPTEAYYTALSLNEEICLNLGIATSLRNPKVHGGFSFDTTVLVSTLASRQSPPTTTDWESLSPLKVLVRPGIDGVYQLPTDTQNSFEGIMCLGIDIPMMAYMFFLFIDHQNKRTDNAIDGVSDLISKFILPNCLYSQFDCILVNCLSKSPLSMKDWNDRTSFSKVDFVSSIQDEINEIRDDTMTRTMLPGDFLMSFPSTQGSFKDLEFNFAGASTVDSTWFEVFANIPLVHGTLLSVKLDNIDEVTNLAMRLDRRVSSARAWRRLDTDLGEKLKEKYDAVLFEL